MPEPLVVLVVILLIAALYAVAQYGDHPADDDPLLDTRGPDDRD